MNIFADPDPSLSYFCSDSVSSTGFTKLMKWVLLTKSYPDLLTNIRQLIETNSTIINQQNTEGWTALMLACFNMQTLSSMTTVKLLISLGADPNLQTLRKSTVLFFVDNDEIIELLKSKMETYTAPDIKTKFACSPYFKASGFTKLMKWTTMTKAHPELLSDIKKLVETDPDTLNKKNDAGWTALMLSVVNSCTVSSNPTVKLLIDLGANLEEKNVFGSTALLLAVCTGIPDFTIGLLVNAKANLKIKTLTGRNLLHFLPPSSKFYNKIKSELDDMKPEQYVTIKKPNHIEIILPEIYTEITIDKLAGKIIISYV